jgi:hypothetical protein
LLLLLLLPQVLQMVGRAGRPQFDTEGVAVIMTCRDSINRYKKLLAGQVGCSIWRQHHVVQDPCAWCMHDAPLSHHHLHILQLATATFSPHCPLSAPAICVPQAVESCLMSNPQT